MTPKKVNGNFSSVLKPAKTSLKPYPIFKEIFSSNLGQYFVKNGEESVALNIAGHLFNKIGNCVLNNIEQDYNRKVFYPFTKAVEISVLDNGEFLVK